MFDLRNLLWVLPTLPLQRLNFDELFVSITFSEIPAPKFVGEGLNHRILTRVEK
jgi:hypothetical protein